MSADHNRLEALRRLANDRAATPAEKATARRLAKAFADKLGKRPCVCCAPSTRAAAEGRSRGACFVGIIGKLTNAGRRSVPLAALRHYSMMPVCVTFRPKCVAAGVRWSQA